MTAELRASAAQRDPRSTADIVASLTQPSMAEDDQWDGIAVLHARGGQDEFDAGAALCHSKDAKNRVLGANILAQLGWGDFAFLKETVGILCALLSDAEPAVVAAAGVALGHRNSPEAISPARALIGHPSSDVRYGVASALCGHDDIAALEGLITLSGDDARDVRNWATFGLAQLTTVDTPQLRDALAARLTDQDPEVRGEAMIGLATRGDERVLPAIERELSGAFFGSWVLEAAATMPRPAYLPLLLSLRARLSAEDRAAFERDLSKAIAACQIS